MNKKLSILICSLKKRDKLFMRLLGVLDAQLTDYEIKKQIEILYTIDEGDDNIGNKRNNLLKRSTGEYVAFIDDDDRPSDDYISKILEALKTNPDCCSLTGIMTTDFLNPETFIHSIKYDRYFDEPAGEGKKIYYRYPNHLNVIKREIAILFQFPQSNFGEDTNWATQIFQSGLLRNEATIDGVIYNYYYTRNK